MMGFRKNDELGCLKTSYIPFDFLYECYGHSKSYHLYYDEFAITSLGWTHRRIFVFIVYFLGMLIFPIQGERIHTRLAMVTKTLMEGIEGQTYTIIPMIVAEMYRALDRCKKGYRCSSLKVFLSVAANMVVGTPSERKIPSRIFATTME